MNNKDRDKFLTEAMGECWHDKLGRPIIPNQDWISCSKCHTKYPTYNNFSTWEGFGKLWTWSLTQVWWQSFCKQLTALDGGRGATVFLSGCYILDIEIHPDKFANALYAFLKERE